MKESQSMLVLCSGQILSLKMTMLFFPWLVSRILEVFLSDHYIYFSVAHLLLYPCNLFQNYNNGGHGCHRWMGERTFKVGISHSSVDGVLEEFEKGSLENWSTICLAEPV